MTLATSRRRAKQLRRVLQEAAHSYWVLNEPVMTDSEYDSLFRELADLERTYPDLATPDSPTQRVGATPAAHHQAVQHRFPMLSLAAAVSISEVRDWYQRMRAIAGHDLVVVGELKLDGVALSLAYERGDLVRAVTRGDGRTGIDVTAQARMIFGIPHRLAAANPPEWVEVRGEAVITTDRFHAINATRSHPYATPRHACAAALQLSDPAQVASRGVQFFAYSMDRSEGNPKCTDSTEFFTSPHRWICGMAEIKEFIHTWNCDRENSVIPTDGLVLKVDDRRLQEQIGASPVAPHWALAVKIRTEEAPALVTRVRDGYARFKPIPLAGATVCYASVPTGFHVSAGDTVVVRGAAGEDPAVVRVLGPL